MTSMRSAMGFDRSRLGILSAIAAAGLLTQGAAGAPPFRIDAITLDAGGVPRVRHAGDADAYSVLLRGSRLSDLSHPVDLQPGQGAVVELSDRTPPRDGAFYQVLRIPRLNALDLDRDGLDDVYELDRRPALDPLDGGDALGDADGDQRSNLEEYQSGTDPLEADFFVTTSPQHEETGVSVHRETLFRFTVPLAEGSGVDGDRLWAEAGGRRLLGRAELSADRRVASLFYLEPVPAATRVRVYLDGSGWQDQQGRAIDLDGDGLPGGVAAIEFTTSSAVAVPGTGVVGYVYASEPMAEAPGPGPVGNRPLAGVTITVDGAEETLRATTDAQGRFELNPAPAGRFFVHVDGRTVVDAASGVRWPDLAYYPFVGKSWEAVAGVATNLAGGTGEIYLPLISAQALQTISPVAETSVSFPAEVVDANPTLAGVAITVPPNALFADDGTRGGRVGLGAVEPDRLPDPLPPGLNFPLVITVQTDGPQNFDQPVPVKFPNLPDPETGLRLPPGAKSALWSFDHDTGTWEIVGPMTVSEDGLLVVSDPGVGIRKPGWHGSNPGNQSDAPPPAPPRRPPGRPPGTGPRPPSGSPPPPPPPPPPDPGEDGDSDDDDDDSFLPDFPELPDLPFIDEPESWGDLVDIVTDRLPTLGPDIFGDIVDIGDAGVEMFNELADVIDCHCNPDSDGNGVSDVMEARDEFLDAIEDAAADQLPMVPDNASDASNSLKEWWDLWNELYGGGAKHDLRKRMAAGGPPSAAVPHLTELALEQEDLDRLGQMQAAFEAYFRALTGTERWDELAGLGIQFQEVLPVVDAVHQAGTSPMGDPEATLITTAEKEGILLINAPRIPSQFREELVARWNRTVANYAAGIVLHPEAPAGETDFIDALEEQTALGGLLAVLDAEFDAGFATPADRLAGLARRLGPALGGFVAAYVGNQRREPSADNQYPVLVETFPLGGTPQSLWLHTDDRGQLNGLRLPAEALVTVRWLDPTTFQTASASFFSGPPGTRSTIPQAVWNETPSPTDSDGDGLPDAAERIVGTLSTVADTDGDGVNDAAEVRAGSNPLDGIALQPGIVGSADTPGNAVDVAVETYDLSRFGGAPSVTRIVVADGEAGVAILEMVAGQPVWLGQVDTPGSATRVALPAAAGLLSDELELAAVVDGAAGLAVVEFSDPTRPRVFHQVLLSGTARSVTVHEGVAYVGLENGRVAVVELYSGEVLQEVELGWPVHDLRMSRGVLYAVGPRFGNPVLQAIPLVGAGLLGTPGEPTNASGLVGRRGFRLAVGEGLAYVIHGTGYNTYNLTNLLRAELITEGTTAQRGWKQVAPDGTGLGVACVGANSTDDGQHEVSVYDLRDAGQTDRFLYTVATPGLASAVALHRGLAYVADGAMGVQVIRYVAPDRGGSPPAATLTVQPEEVVTAGARLAVQASVSDDVQVRTVELVIDDVTVATDGAWPFEFHVSAPVFDPERPSVNATHLVLQLRAIDGAGEAALSAPVSLRVEPDIVAPEILSFSPGLGRAVIGADAAVSVAFNEPLDPASLTPAVIGVVEAGPDGALGTADDEPVTGATLSYLERAHRPLLTFSSGLPSGTYRIEVSPGVRDASGNELGAAASSDFRVLEVDLRGGGRLEAVGELAEVGLRDGYSFLADAGQRVFFDIEERASVGVQWTVLDPSGNELFRSAMISDRGVTVLPADGRYRLSLMRTGDFPGPYRVSVWEVPAPQTFSIEVGDVVSDGVPGSGAGRIETPGVADVYTFAVAPAQPVFFDVQAGASAGLSWLLVDESGEEVFDRGFISDSGVIELTRGGTYTLTVGRATSDFQGTYQFQLWGVPAAEAFNIAVGDVISEGVPSAGAGRIESPGASDRYSFTAAAGQRVFFDIQSGASAGLSWRLVDAAEEEVFDRGFISDTGVIELTLGGEYTLIVGRESSDFAGDYRFQLWEVPAAEVFAVAVGEVISDGVPATGAGRIESPGAADVYTFTAAAGQAVFFDLQAGVSAGLSWRLADETGEDVFDRGFISDPGTVVLTRGGEYTLTVGRSSSDYSGTYRVQLWDVPAPESFAIALGDVVSEGVPAVGAGRIESPGALDLYTFSVAPGQRAFFDILAGASAGLSWRLVDDAGDGVFDRVFISDPGAIELTRGGTYTLTLGREGSDYRGTYQFQIRPEP